MTYSTQLENTKYAYIILAENIFQIRSLCLDLAEKILII
jgi:hypothetical protein